MTSTMMQGKVNGNSADIRQQFLKRFERDGVRCEPMSIDKHTIGIEFNLFGLNMRLVFVDSELLNYLENKEVHARILSVDTAMCTDLMAVEASATGREPTVIMQLIYHAADMPPHQLLRMMSTLIDVTGGAIPPENKTHFPTKIYKDIPQAAETYLKDTDDILDQLQKCLLG